MAVHRRGPWSQAEDMYLCQLVHTQGALNWVRIAQLIGSRSPKQCRERYHQNLKPTLNHEPISPEEGLQIERLVAEMGKRWAEIARRLNGRSDNAVKNWWNGSMNRQRRLMLRRRTASHCQNTFDERTQTLSFARPVPSRQLSIARTNFPPMHTDGPLLSPTTSEGSRAGSVDGAPSLISDNGSAFSVSPRLHTSSSLELPHLNHYNLDGRRPSLPMLHFPPNPHHSETDSHFQTRFPVENKAHSITLHPPFTYRRPDQPSSPREFGQDSRQLLTAPPTPIQLAPMLSPMQKENQRPNQKENQNPNQKDSRMDLSSLLG